MKLRRRMGLKSGLMHIRTNPLPNSTVLMNDHVWRTARIYQDPGTKACALRLLKESTVMATTISQIRQETLPVMLSDLPM